MYYDKDKIRMIIIAGIIVVMSVVLLFIGGCATRYDLVIEKDAISGNVTKIEGHTKSYREAAMFRFVYNPENGGVELLAVGVTDDTAEVVSSAVGVVGNVAKAYISPLSSNVTD